MHLEGQKEDAVGRNGHKVPPLNTRMMLKVMKLVSNASEGNLPGF